MDLDPVEVLRHLNVLGYENVEPHLLQKFMKDLKKLIKYEKRKSLDDVQKRDKTDFNIKIQHLLKEKNVTVPDNQCKNEFCTKKKNDVFERLSRPSSKTKLCSKAVTTIGVQTDLQYKHIKDNNYSQVLKRKKMDPVSLHQYYKTEWQAHKVPGENNHDQLRWQVRKMMMPK